jgi:putative hydrolase of the HAD superfamily
MSSEVVHVVFFDLADTLVTSSQGWVTGAQGVLSTLRTKGVRLGVISNTGTLSRTQLLQLLPSDFDMKVFESKLVLLSSEVGVEKPALEIFQRAVERAGAQPSQCLFCTENFADTLAAQQVGMRVARLQRPPASDLQELIDGMVRAHMLI